MNLEEAIEILIEKQKITRLRNEKENINNNNVTMRSSKRLVELVAYYVINAQ